MTATDRYCRECLYALRDLERTTCPECGRAFDPSDPSTTTRHPIGDRAAARAVLVRVMTLLLCAIAGGVLIASAWGVSPLWLWLASIAAAPMIVCAVGLACLTPVRRTRGILLGVVLLLASVVLTDWPFRVSFRLHEALFERRVAAVRDGTVTPGRGMTRVGAYSVLAVTELRNGSIGFQLTGDGGGGTYVVKKADTATFVWTNTNWERDLGNGWWFVEQD